MAESTADKVRREGIRMHWRATPAMLAAVKGGPVGKSGRPVHLETYEMYEWNGYIWQFLPDGTFNGWLCAASLAEQFGLAKAEGAAERKERL